MNVLWTICFEVQPLKSFWSGFEVENGGPNFELPIELVLRYVENIWASANNFQVGLTFGPFWSRIVQVKALLYQRFFI